LLLCSKILQPVSKEMIHIEEVARGRREDGDVTRPTETFIALRAIGGHVEEVPAQTPDDVSMQLVEHLV
jgi:hypothetical protein